MNEYRATRCLLLAAAALLACDKGPGGGAKKIPRDENAPAVVVVEAQGEQAMSFTDEVEPNNEPEQAAELAPGSGVRGSLDGEVDVDLYRIKALEPRSVRAQLGGIEGVDLVLELRDQEGNVLARSDRGPATTPEGIANFPIGPGEYHLAVLEFVKKRSKKSKEPVRVGASPVYELTLERPGAPERGHEIEPNDSMESATEVTIGDEAVGYLGWARDTDFWKISIEGFAAHYSLDIELEGVPGLGLSLAVLDGGGNEVLKRSGDKGQSLGVRNLVVVPEGAAPAGEGKGEGEGQAAPPRPPSGQAEAAGYYYLKLTTARSSSPLDPYRLRMGMRLLDVDEEVEPNDTPDTARALRESETTLEGVRKGFLHVGDVDHYQVTAGAEPLILSLKATPQSGVDIELTVLMDGATVATANGDQRGGRETLPDVRIEAGKTAVIKVHGSGGLGLDAAYELGFTAELAGAAPGQGQPGDDTGVFDDYEE